MLNLSENSVVQSESGTGKQLSVPRRSLILIGSLGPIGHLPASGTVTVAVIGCPLFWLTRSMSVPSYLAAVLGFSLVAVWIHHVGDRWLGEKDSRRLVWDELAGFLVAVIAVPWTWQTALAAFLLERALDIAKVQPARWIERRWPGGWGVVGDDLVAGIYACLILHGLIRFFPGIMGLSVS